MLSGNKYLFFFIMLTVNTCILLSQEKQDTRIRMVPLISLRPKLPRYSFLEPSYHIQLSETIPFDRVLDIMDERTQQSFAWTMQYNQIDVAAPWKQFLARQNEDKTLYVLLGSVQMGGAAYIAYRHLKKYGWK